MAKMSWEKSMIANLENEARREVGKLTPEEQEILKSSKSDYQKKKTKSNPVIVHKPKLEE